MRKKILTFFGTRPEAIKMVPVIKALRENNFDVTIGLSGQHIQMVQDIFDLFDEKADFSLDIQNQTQNVEDTLTLCLQQLCDHLRKNSYDLILVHGDTSSTLAGAMAGYYCQIPVGHVEAGLRSHNNYSPWPEEINRKLTGQIAELHFAPTSRAVSHLEAEGVSPKKIFKTGNTVVDALYLMNEKLKTDHDLNTALEQKFSFLNRDKKWVLFTGHRRENLGQGLHNVMKAILELSKRPDVEVIFPIHPNPKVRASFSDLLTPNANIQIIDPLPYSEMVWMLSQCDLIITDSGGLQEEAPSFQVPVIVTRDTTERQESVDMGWAKLVGTNTQSILSAAETFLDSEKTKQTLAQLSNPYGDGKASTHIVEALYQFWNRN